MTDLGKVDRSFFERHVASNLGTDREDVALGPTHGVDFGVVDVGGTALEARDTVVAEVGRVEPVGAGESGVYVEANGRSFRGPTRRGTPTPSWPGTPPSESERPARPRRRPHATIGTDGYDSSRYRNTPATSPSRPMLPHSGRSSSAISCGSSVASAARSTASTHAGSIDS